MDPVLDGSPGGLLLAPLDCLFAASHVGGHPIGLFSLDPQVQQSLNPLVGVHSVEGKRVIKGLNTNALSPLQRSVPEAMGHRDGLRRGPVLVEFILGGGEGADPVQVSLEER